MQLTVGSKIRDDNGREGIVTSLAVEYGGKPPTACFARPVGVPYRVADRDGVTGVAGASLITATAWHLQDGRLYGVWYDSPLNALVYADVVDDDGVTKVSLNVPDVLLRRIDARAAALGGTRTSYLLGLAAADLGAHG